MEEKIKKIFLEYERCDKLKNAETPIDAAIKILAPFGLTEDYTEGSLKKAYREACNSYHPDKTPGLPKDIYDKCTALFQFYNEANEKLLKKLKGIDDEKNQIQETYSFVTSLLSKSKLENNSVSEIKSCLTLISSSLVVFKDKAYSLLGAILFIICFNFRLA